MTTLAMTRRRIREASLGWAEGYAHARSRKPSPPATWVTARVATGVLGLLDPWAFRTPFLTRQQALRLARSADPMGAMLRLRDALRSESAPLATLRGLATAPAMIEGELAGRSGRRFRLSTSVERSGGDPREIAITVWDGPDSTARAVGDITLHATTPWVVRDHVEIYHPEVRREGIVGTIRKRIGAAMPPGCQLIDSLAESCPMAWPSCALTRRRCLAPTPHGPGRSGTSSFVSRGRSRRTVRSAAGRASTSSQPPSGRGGSGPT